MPGAGEEERRGRKHPRQVAGWDKRAPLRGAHLPHERRRGVAVREPICHVQQLRPHRAHKVRRPTLRYADKPEHIPRGVWNRERRPDRRRACRGAWQRILRQPAQPGGEGGEPDRTTALRHADKGIHREAMGLPGNGTASGHNKQNTSEKDRRQQVFLRPLSRHSHRRLFEDDQKNARGHRGENEC